MFGSSPSPFPPETLDRLGKLVPRLGSDHDGEVVATVAAIGRTLKAAKLDWHDLGRRVAEPSMLDEATRIAAEVDEMVRKAAAARPTYSYTPPKPKPEPSPWPTFGTTSAQNRLRWMEAARTSPHYHGMKKRREFDALYDRLYSRPHEGVTRKEVNLWNIVVRLCWEMGMRLDPREAA